MSTNLSSEHDSSDKPIMTRQQRWRAENRTAYRAHLAVQAARRKGILKKPDRCQCCGKVGKLDAHHPDHRDPLRVVWLTRGCHVRLHRRRKGGAS